MDKNTENFDRPSVLRHFEKYLAGRDSAKMLEDYNGYLDQRVEAFRSWINKTLYKEMMLELDLRNRDAPFAERLPLLGPGGSGKESDRNARHFRDALIVAVLERRREMTHDDNKVFMFTEKEGRRSLIHEMSLEINERVARVRETHPRSKVMPQSVSPEYIYEKIWKKKTKIDPRFLSIARNMAEHDDHLDPTFKL